MLKKRLRLKFIVMASITMLAIIGFSSFEAKGQVCPGVKNKVGWLRIGVSTASDFTAGLLGTVEAVSTGPVGGIDWLYNNGAFSFDEFGSPDPLLPTTAVGGQLISWWSQNGRDTFIQVTNTATNVCKFDLPKHECDTDSDCTKNTCRIITGSTTGTCTVSGEPCTVNRDCTKNTCDPANVNVHVQILGENCVELRDFCDSFTPNDTHIYDLGNLVSNAGVPIPVSNLQGHEGVIVITPVDSCPDPNSAVEFNFLQGNMRLIDSRNFEFGTNVYARAAASGVIGVCNSTTSCSSDAACTAISKNLVCDTNKGFCTAKQPCTSDLDCPSTFPTCDTDPIIGGLAVRAFCDDLNGLDECRFDPVIPTQLSQNFSITSLGTSAAADLVLISLNDSYGTSPNFTYSITPGSASYAPGIFDDAENFTSCTTFSGCFTRIGVDDPLPGTNSFSPTPVPTTPPPPKVCTKNSDCPSGFICLLPTPSGGTPAPGVCVPAPTTSPKPTPTKKPSGGGGGGCSIGGPAEVGTAMANVLVPLVPAFAIGFRVLRRRSRKNQK